MNPVAGNNYEAILSDGRLLNSINIPLSVETVCVFTAPIFSANAAWATYLLTKVCVLADLFVVWILGFDLRFYDDVHFLFVL